MINTNKFIALLFLISLVCSAAAAVCEERRYAAPEYVFEEFTPEENRINLNTASEEELSSLDGIGPVIAGKIIAFRTEVRPFETIYDLKLVQGIGDKLFEKNKTKITVGE